MGRRLTVIAVVVLGIVAALALWWMQGRAERAERQLGLDAARTLSESFVKARDMRVATLSGEVIARGADPGFAGLLPTSLTIKYPYSVDYILDLRRVTGDAYRWDAATRTLNVQLPDVALAKPNVDASAAMRIGTTGAFMTRDAAQRLNAQVAARATLRAADAAAKLEHMNRARASAKEAMQALVATPLRAAGLGEVKVVARFAWEGVNPGAAIPWDESTSIENALAPR